MQGYQINSEHFSEAIVYSLELESVAQHNQDRINSVLMGMNPPSDLDINSYIYRLKALVSNLTNEASIIKNSTLGILESVNRTEAELGSDINAYFWEDLIMWLVVNNKSIDDSIFNYLSPEVREQVKKQMLNYLYNGTTHYGGDQIGPLKGYTNGDTMYAQIIRKYFPKMTEEEVLDYLQSINNVGCGYVAIANYVFEGYIDKPEQFQNKFGFPMFYTDEDGNIVSSINYLVTDIYCNSNKKGLSFNFLVPEEPTQIGTINGYYSGYRGDSRNANGLNKFNEKEILSDERYKEANINKKVLTKTIAILFFLWFNIKALFFIEQKNIKNKY